MSRQLQTVQSSQPPQQRCYQYYHQPTGSFSTTVVAVAVAADDDADSVGAAGIAEGADAEPRAFAHTVAEVALVETHCSNQHHHFHDLTRSQVGTSLYCSSPPNFKTTKNPTQKKGEFPYPKRMYKEATPSLNYEARVFFFLSRNGVSIEA